MPQTNPILIFSEDKTPSVWCYFDLNPDNTLTYYTAPYDTPDSAWEETPLPEAPLYVYNPKTKERLCYAVKENQLYEKRLRFLQK